MKIKDIREYRTFYKEQVLEISDKNRDEHFIGVKNKVEDGSNVYGYFNITHGDKIKDYTDGIKGFLEGFLDMARDAQAVYEFLQNAVDANSSRFLMIWGEDEEDGNDYLLVLNNGYQFDYAAVRSILNVGVSTKSQEQHTIGKFGIGFKLAHRLVGKDNGLDELLNRNYGPLLYSWKNTDIKEIIQFQNEEIEIVKQNFCVNGNDDISYTGLEPWLFKILITNFPSQPNEQLRDVYYKSTNQAFRSEEIVRLSKWLRASKGNIPLEEFDEGSLFFIRLGEDKKQHLEDENLAEGVKFSLSVLNHTSDDKIRGLKHVHLNGIDIQSAELEFEEIVLSKNSKEFKHVRFNKTEEESLNNDEVKLVEKDTDIQILLGYTTYDKAYELFNNAPNFYLYFPLSVEKHNLKFIIHSNAFYKASHRTSLHIGTKGRYGINERLLETFANILITRMSTWSDSDSMIDRLKFLRIYPVLLMSNLSDDSDRSWINDPLVENLHSYLKNNIPVITNTDKLFEIVSSTNNVRIKATNLEIDTLNFGLDIKWFYWGNDQVLKDSVTNILGIKEFRVIDLLYEKESHIKINKLLEINPTIRPNLLFEINNDIASVTGSGNESDTFKDNFHELNLFEFEDGKYKSINTLRTPDNEIKYLLLFEELESIRDLLSKAGFVSTKESLSKYPSIQDFIRKRQSISYNDYKVLNEYLSTGFEISNFTPAEKHKICQTLEKAKDRETEVERNQRMQVLRLFANANGDIVALGSLINETTKGWLKPFEISSLENQEYLQRYLVQQENDMFKKVVIPLWEHVIADKKGLIRNDLKSFFTDITIFQEATKQTQSLSNKVFIPIKEQFVVSSNLVYYQPDWSVLNANEYIVLTDTFKKVFKKDLPTQDVLPFLKQAPFSLSNSTFDSLLIETDIEITSTEISILAKAAIIAKMPFFEKFIFESYNESFLIRNKKEDEEIIWFNADDKVIDDHVKTFYKSLVICPRILELKSLIFLKDKELAEYFIGNWINDSEVFENSLSDLVVSQEDSIKSLYLNNIGDINIDLRDYKGYNKLKNAMKVSLSFADVVTPKDILQDYLSFTIDENKSFKINEIVNSNSDSIYFGEANEYQLKLSEIFTSEETGYSKHIESIIEKLNKDYSFDKTKLGQLFNLRESESKVDIFERINASIQLVGHIVNASQLGFLLLYKKYISKEIELSTYYIKFQESIVKLDGSFSLSLESFDLFKNETYLDSIYVDIKDILKLSLNLVFFKVESVSLYLQPVIENNTLLGPDLKENLSPEEQIKLLDFLLSQNRSSTPLNYSKSWSNVFGFNPKLFVSARYALKGIESLPEHIFKWSWNEKVEERKKHKAALLSALGFNLPWSLINTLREVLIDEKSSKVFIITELELLPVELLANTLVYIQNEYPNYKISTSHKYFDIIKSLVKLSIQNSILTIPLPCFTTNQNEFILVDNTQNNVFYYDNDKFHELFKLNVELSEIIEKANIQVYDATKWTDSQELKAVLNEIEITEQIDNELVVNKSEEWSDVFYEEWKQKYQEISLFYYDSLTKKLFVSDKYVKSIEEYQYHINEYIIYCPRKFSFIEITNTLKQEDWLTIEAIDELVQLYNSHQMKVMELLNNPIIDEEIRKIVDDKKKELQEIAYRKELKESLAQNKYSYKWFLDFIEIQKLQVNEADDSKPEQEISFFAAEWEIDSQRLIRLKDPNRSVTPTIEYCTDFSAIFYFNNSKTLEVKIQDVSKKGQVVLAMLSKPMDLKNANLKDVKRVELKFSRSVNLLGRLYTAFKRLGYEKVWEDEYNLKENLPHEISFIFGPPGTGKTTTIAERLIALMESKPDAKVLVLTPTNKAADVLTQKIMAKINYDDYWLVRYGATFSNEIIENNILRDANTFVYESYEKCVFVSTIHRLPYEEFILKIENNEPERIKMANAHWDYVIFDESSMLPLSYITYAIFQCESQYDNRKTEYWVGGDPLQIPPVIDISDEDLPEEFEKEANIYTLIELNSFDKEEQKKIPIYGENNKIENLTTQYRSIESIGSLFSKFTYNDKLEHYRDKCTDQFKYSRPLPAKIEDLGIKPITLLKFPVNQDDSVYRPGKLRKSPYHIYSALLVLEIIRHFESSISDNENWTIGIVCPYRSQATLVNKMIESLNLKHNMSVITDTVHGFQGDECDIVFFIVNPPNNSISHPNYGAFVHKHYLINVAISRAKDYLVILYPDNNTQGINNLVKINQNNLDSIEYILKNKMNINLNSITIQSDTIEEKIFEEKKYIEKNILTNTHQIVNVYNDAQKKYIVKESSTAIDIQFKS